uniref:Uncharacterized protein LOC114342913 n=1 Tax=Diabrotica virgifera virgifera TaxID=50390 RepID=A0A6P7GU32_DIAVI
MEFEDCVQESIARHQKSFNLILYNLPEPEGDDKEAEDVSTVSTIIDTIKPRNPSFASVFRIGKFSNKPRPVKVKFFDNDSPLFMLRNKRRLLGTQFSRVVLKDDLTKYQINYLHKVREELEKRKILDKDLTIKYINKVPTIVNTNQQPTAKNE